MGETLSERILGATPGTYVDRPVDHAFAHDGTGVLTLEALRELNVERIPCPEKIHLLFDHISPANSSLTATLQKELRQYAKEKKLHFSDIGGGICHQLMSENVVLPGEIVVGADSHSCTMGAFGAFSTGVGATDMAAIWATGETWFRVPETIGILLEGTLQFPAEPKDVALTYVEKLGMDGATYKALEFIGKGAESISMDGRLTLCNMAVESGAKAGIFYADDITRRYLAEHGRKGAIQSIEECDYSSELTIDLTDITPKIAVPHRVDNVVDAKSLQGKEIDQVFIGTCTNGRYEDLKRLHEILNGRKVLVRTIVAPASRLVFARALEEGIITSLIKSGCIVCPPGCGPCLGAHQGVIGEGEICLSTANRNFKNRMGVGGEIYLSSVSTAAASALSGEITIPEGF